MATEVEMGMLSAAEVGGDRGSFGGRIEDCRSEPVANGVSGRASRRGVAGKRGMGSGKRADGAQAQTGEMGNWQGQGHAAVVDGQWAGPINKLDPPRDQPILSERALAAF